METLARTPRSDVEPSSNGIAQQHNKSHAKDLPLERKPVHVKPLPKLKRVECFFAIIVFVFWLALFAGGITVDTRSSRCLISEGGVKALEEEAKYKNNPCGQFDVITKTMLFRASVIVLLWFLPINLALICATAGALGSFGNRADLSDDKSPPPSRDDSNPYISAMLRGLFVYLIMISGLLVLDVNPFFNPSPGQYIRLAGFLSLFSFVLSYQPRVFRKIIVWTYHRIEEKEGPGTPSERAGINVHYEKETTHESATIHKAPEGADALNQLTAPETNKSSRNESRVDIRKQS
jgi:predicted secreted protein